MGLSRLALLVLLLPVAGLAAEPMVARRTDANLRIDGALDEEAWRAAPFYDAFVESFPHAGAKPGLKTEARILYDDQFLYVGVTCFDPNPGELSRQLGRRDSTPAADRIEVSIDSALDRRTAYSFSVNVAGVQRDQLLFADVNTTESWDAVWAGFARETKEGWSAELAIPLRVLRFSAAPDQSWGILIRRYVPRTRQVLDSTLIPREAHPVTPGAAVVSRFGLLTGLHGLKPGRQVEFLPYFAAKATMRPQFSDPLRTSPSLINPSLDLGLDFRIALSSDLNLTGAINPDFGQVEADQLIQNLQNAEPFFPEKRPFFLQGLDVFQPVGAEYFSPQQLFYSRRIGLTAPILGAVKLTGSARENLEIGLLDALVMGAGNISASPLGYGDADPQSLESLEANPDRRWRFRLRQPFHFGPENALPLAHPVTTNYFAGVARQRFGRTSVGASFTAATPLEPRCREGEFPSTEVYLAAGCASGGGNAAALDFNTRDASGDWGAFGQFAASQTVGGERGGRVLTDGTLLRPGDFGFGGHFRAGKLNGEPFRFDVVYVYEDSKLDLNHVGFQPLTNYQWVDLNLHYVRPSGMGPFHNFSVDYMLDLNWSTDGKFLPRGINTYLQSQLQLPSFDQIGVKAGLEMPQYETREIRYAGVPFERVPNVFAGIFFTTDVNRRLFAKGELFGALTSGWRNHDPAKMLMWTLNVTWRPVDRLESYVEASYGHKPLGPRWVETLPDNTAVFGEQDPAYVSITVREQWVITPRLTAQIYAQLFSESLRYGSFFAASLNGRDHLRLDELEPYAYGNEVFHHGSVLNLNAVLRWEYRLGSTLFFVYTRSQSEPPSLEAPSSVLPMRLFSGPVTQSLLLKWSYWWG